MQGPRELTLLRTVFGETTHGAKPMLSECRKGSYRGLILTYAHKFD